LRTARTSNGGRYNPVTGDLMPEYNYGLPFLIAIDTRRYRDNNSLTFNRDTPGEIHVDEPVLLEDIVLLFGPKLEPHRPLEHSKIVNLLGEIGGAFKNQGYADILQRNIDANLEDAAVVPPELI
jgi:hypothetical protein